jgi:hypothetical protein
MNKPGLVRYVPQIVRLVSKIHKIVRLVKFQGLYLETK